MRILIPTACVFPHNHPLTQRFVPFVRTLSQRGHQITICALSPGEKKPATANLGNAKLIVVDRNKLFERQYDSMKHKLAVFLPMLDIHPLTCLAMFRACSKIISKEPYDIILASSPPISSLAVAKRLSIAYGIPWVADLRDLPDEYAPDRKSLFIRRRSEWVGKAIQSALSCTTVSSPLVDALEERYAYQGETLAITNGYDSTIVEYRDPQRLPTFTLGYFGGFYGERRLDLLIEAVNRLILRNDTFNQIKLKFYSPEGEKLFAAYSSRTDMPILQRIQLCGLVDHSAAISAMYECAMLINLTSEKWHGVLPVKMFEYAATGRPILSLPRDGGMIDEFIQRSGTGYLASTLDEIGQVISEKYAQWQATGTTTQPSRNSDYLSKYDRNELAKAFAQHIEYCFEQHLKTQSINLP